MGADAAQRINGPWLVELDFPSVFTTPLVPETFKDITESVQVFTPPTPVYGAVCGGNPIGLHIKGAYPFRHIRLPVFEWTGLAQSITSPFPLRKEHYFTLSNKFKGESFRTPRITIGKVALLDDVVTCAIPVSESRLSKTTVAEISIPKQPTVQESIAQAVFAILNGESQPEGHYSESKYEYALKRGRDNIEKRAFVRKIIQDRSISTQTQN